jgi:hypothetical protein
LLFGPPTLNPIFYYFYNFYDLLPTLVSVGATFVAFGPFIVDSSIALVCAFSLLPTSHSSSSLKSIGAATLPKLFDKFESRAGLTREVCEAGLRIPYFESLIFDSLWDSTSSLESKEAIEIIY